MLGKDEKQTFVSIDFMTQKSSKHPSTSLDQNEHAFNFVGDVNEGIISKLGAPGTNFFGGSGGCPNQRLERAYNGASKIGGFPHGDEIRGWGTLSWWASGVWATGSVTDLRSSTCTKVE